MSKQKLSLLLRGANGQAECFGLAGNMRWLEQKLVEVAPTVVIEWDAERAGWGPEMHIIEDAPFGQLGQALRELPQ
jgi:hypothetical protein